jgi:hypothetical protein
MFDIINSRDFYRKLLEDFDDYMGQQDSARLVNRIADYMPHAV